MFQKGYCKPEELEEAEREGGEMFDSSEGGGVGEGQGTTDVSDQITSEEQVGGDYSSGDCSGDCSGD